MNYICKKQDSSIYARTTMHFISVLLEGKKTVHLKDENIIVNSKEICFFTQNNYFMSERLVENKTYKSLVIYFDDNFIFDFINKYNIDINIKEQSDIGVISYKKDSLFSTCVDTFQEYIDKNFDENLLKLKIEEIFLNAIRVDKEFVFSYFNKILSTSQDRIKFILESNIDLIHSLSDICALTRMTESKVRTYIKKNYNQTPKVWIDTKRLEKAVLLLKNSEDSISDISTSCGYSTTSWFISQFKKYYNITPKEFRQKS